MVLHFEALEGILRDHCALLEIVAKACENWGLEAPFGDDTVGVAQDNLEAVRSLLRAGIEDVRTPEKKA